MEKENEKPFYLLQSKINKRRVVILGLMIGIISILSPFLLVILPFYIGFVIWQYKKLSRKENIRLNKGIEYFNEGKVEQCKKEVEIVLFSEPENVKAKIIIALVQYEQGRWQEAVTMLEKIPFKIINEQLDLKMKIAEGYLKLGMYSKALEQYKWLLKINTKSKFILERVELCKKKSSE